MRWKLKNKKARDEASKIVTGTGRKFRLHVGKRKLISLVLVLVLVSAGLWYFKIRVNSPGDTTNAGKALEINLAEETAKTSTDGMTNEQKLQFYMSLARSYESNSDYEKAGDALVKASEFTADDTKLFVDAATNYSYSGNEKKASEYAKKALGAIDENNAENFEQVGDLYAYSDNKTEAKAFYEKAIQNYQNKSELDGDITKEEIINRIESKIDKL